MTTGLNLDVSHSTMLAKPPWHSVLPCSTHPVHLRSLEIQKLGECKVSNLKNDLPAYTANDPSGLHTSSLHSSPTSVGGVTTISKSTSSALPLNHHLSSQLALLPWRFFTLDGLTMLRLGGALGLGRVGDVSCDDGNNLFPESSVCTRGHSADSSASLRLRERTTTGRGKRLYLTPFHSQRSAASLSPLSRFAIQRRQSENRRKSRSFGNEPPSSWKSEPRLRKLRPGAMSWKGRLGVLRWRAKRSRVCACECSEAFIEVVTEKMINLSDETMLVVPLTLGNKCMDGQKRGIFRVFDVDTIHEIL